MSESGYLIIFIIYISIILIIKYNQIQSYYFDKKKKIYRFCFSDIHKDLFTKYIRHMRTDSYTFNMFWFIIS